MLFVYSHRDGILFYVIYHKRYQMQANLEVLNLRTGYCMASSFLITKVIGLSWHIEGR